MEVSSKIPFKVCTTWQGLLITVSFLTCWHLSTTASVTIELVPPHVANGENILLLVRNLPKNVMAFAWIKGVARMNHAIVIHVPDKNLSMPGHEHSGRETVYSNGSLLLQNVNEKDTGFYILRTFNRLADIVLQTSIYVFVYPFLWTCGNLATSPRSTIESVPFSVADGGSVLLLVRNPPENNVGYIWFKWTTWNKRVEVARYTLDTKLTEWGPAYSGRETLFSDGSMLLHGVTQDDLRLYTVRILRTYMESEEAHVQLQMDTSHSLLCNPPTSSQLTIEPVSWYLAEGENILLQVHNLPEDLQSFFWYKSPNPKIVDYIRITNFISWEPTHRKRGWMVYNNGSLMVQNITENDAGKYTLVVLNKVSKIEKAHVHLYVKKNVTQPFVQITDTTAAGRQSVIFSCISPDTDISIHWIFNNQSLKLSERMTLSPTKCGLRIDPVRSEDAGEYKCEVFNQFGLKTSLPVSWP